MSVPRELYPFTGQVWERDGLRLHHLDEGAGDPVVMLHGNPTWSILFRHLVPALRATHRVIVPDHIGMGLSDKPAADRYGYRLADRIADLEGLLEAKGARRNLTLVMHDWGGMIGMGFATRHPERIARLVLCNTAAFHLPPGMRLPVALAVVRDSRVGALAVTRGNAFARAAAAVGCKRRPMSAALRAAYLAPYDTPAHRLGTLRFVQDIPLEPSHPSYAEVSRIEAGLAAFARTPTLIAWGMRDFVFTPAVLQAWRARWPGAEVHEFADCGHTLPEDAPDELAGLVQRFLAAHPVRDERGGAP